MSNSLFPDNSFNNFSNNMYPNLADSNPQEALTGSVFQQFANSTIMYLPYTILDPSVHAGALAGRVTLVDSSGFQYELVSTPFPFGFDPSVNTMFNPAASSATLTDQTSPNLNPMPEVDPFSFSPDSPIVPNKKRERTVDGGEDLLPAPSSKRRKSKPYLPKTKKLHKKLEDSHAPAELFTDWSMTKQKERKKVDKSYVVEPFAKDHNGIYYQAMKYLGSRKGLTAELLFNQVITVCKEGDEDLKKTCESAINFIRDHMGKEYMGVTIQPI